MFCGRTLAFEACVKDFLVFAAATDNELKNNKYMVQQFQRYCEGKKTKSVVKETGRMREPELFYSYFNMLSVWKAREVFRPLVQGGTQEILDQADRLLLSDEEKSGVEEDGSVNKRRKVEAKN